MDRSIMFVEYPLGDLLPKDFAALSLEGTKYIDTCSAPFWPRPRSLSAWTSASAPAASW